MFSSLVRRAVPRGGPLASASAKNLPHTGYCGMDTEVRNRNATLPRMRARATVGSTRETRDLIRGRDFFGRHQRLQLIVTGQHPCKVLIKAHLSSSLLAAGAPVGSSSS